MEGNLLFSNTEFGRDALVCNNKIIVIIVNL